jgi:sigma-E factor negative regulatory protein RseA
VVADAATPSANDAALRWKWLAAVASVFAVAVLGWHVGSVNTGASTQLATAPAAGQSAQAGLAVSSAEPAVMLRDPRLDELLAAHRRFGGTSALQMPAGFLRNATFEQPER